MSLPEPVEGSDNFWSTIDGGHTLNMADAVETGLNCQHNLDQPD